MFIKLEELTDECVRATVRQLRVQSIRPYPDGYYHGHISREQLSDFEKFPGYSEYAYSALKADRPAIYGVIFFPDLHGEIAYIEGVSEDEYNRYRHELKKVKNGRN